MTRLFNSAMSALVSAVLTAGLFASSVPTVNLHNGVEMAAAAHRSTQLTSLSAPSAFSPAKRAAL